MNMTEQSTPEDPLRVIIDMVQRGTIPDTLPGSPEQQEELKEILQTIQAVHSFISDLSEGELEATLPFRGYLAGPLKALQSSLRHLTWQTKMVAEGDLNQRVDFLGDFSTSYNRMVTNLSDTREELLHRQEELTRSYEALAQANNKLNILSSITRHDILNHVMVITYYSSLVREAVTDAESRKRLAAIEKSGTEIQHLIEFTRNYQDLGVVEPVWQDITLIMQKPVIKSLTDTLKLTLPPPGVEIYTDQMLEKVLYNLVENSIRHGGEVSELQIRYEEGDGPLQVIYEDNGQGIPDDEKVKVFKRGYGKNTGLGLFLIREILSITNIQIIESGEAGKGVRFVMTIPPDSNRHTSL